MRYVDAHVHLSDEEYAQRVEEVIAEAKNANVVALVSNSVDVKTGMENLRIAAQHPGLVYVALGVHPWNVQTLADDELQQVIGLIREQRQNKTLVAVGEVGLDSKYAEIWERQVQVFEEMLRLAEQLDLPVVIHSRGAIEQILGMLPSYKLRRILLHWFSRPITALPRAVELGCFITEGPPTAYSKSTREIVKTVPLDRLMTETDGPLHYFGPPFKGKTTTPAHLLHVINAIAEIKEMSAEDVADQVIKNFEQFFSVKLY